MAGDSRAVLYGAPHSLYSGKVRAYLRKQGIAFVERMPADPRFRAEVVPAIGRGIIPVLVWPDGRIVQDTVDIIDDVERRGAALTAYPAGPVQRVVAHLAELYAVVGLTRHAMHYRWSYLAEQERFLRDQFAAGSGAAAAEAVMARMQSYLPALGVTPDTIPAIERSFAELLDLLDAQFGDQPYLLGGQPSIGDYALYGPLFAHLGRDPVPADLMRRRAPRLVRWLERMGAPDPDLPEFGERPAAFLPDDAIPPTIWPLLRHAAAELLPELLDQRAALAAFVADTDPREGTPVTAKPHQRTIGRVATSFRGVPIESGVMPYHFFLWQRVIDAVAALGPGDRAGLLAEAGPIGLAPVLDAVLPIRVERRDHLEVWGRRG